MKEEVLKVTALYMKNYLYRSPKKGQSLLEREYHIPTRVEQSFIGANLLEFEYARFY